MENKQINFTHDEIKIIINLFEEVAFPEETLKVDDKEISALMEQEEMVLNKAREINSIFERAKFYRNLKANKNKGK